MLGLATKKLLINLSFLSLTVGGYTKFEADVNEYNDKREAKLHYFEKKCDSLHMNNVAKDSLIDDFKDSFAELAISYNNLEIDNSVLKNQSLINAQKNEDLQREVKELREEIKTLKNRKIYSYPDSIHNLIKYAGHRTIAAGEEIFVDDTNKRVIQNKSIIVPLQRQIKIKGDTIK